MIDLMKAPFPVTYRELWLPPSVNNNATLPSSVRGGHGLTLTGARKGSTVDGVHFTGVATSNINCGAIHSDIPKLWISFRFKLDQDFTAASATIQYLFGKFNATDYILLSLRDGTGSLQFELIRGGATRFLLTSTTDSWNAGQWYHILVSFSDTVPAQRMLIDNVLEDSDTQAAFNTPAAGDFVIGDRDDPGLGTGFKGVIADFFCGTDDLSVAEEAELYNGIPPANVVNEYLLDEGRGVTAYDRGSGSNNGTLDTDAEWAWGRVKQPVISFDCINDVATSGAGVDVSGALTLATVIKAKSTYDGLAADHYLAHLFVDADNELRVYYDNAADTLRFHAEGGGTAQTVDYTTRPVIDDYLILILTLTAGGVLASYVNGSLIGTTTGVGAIAGATTAYIGAEQTPSLYDISKPLFAALIDGAFTQNQARAYSRYLKNVFNLPISI